MENVNTACDGGACICERTGRVGVVGDGGGSGGSVPLHIVEMGPATFIYSRKKMFNEFYPVSCAKFIE